MDIRQYDERTTMNGTTFQSLAMALKRYNGKPEFFSLPNYIYVPGPVNSAICYLASMQKEISPLSCFSSSPSCSVGSTLALWILVPPVLNWTTSGNITLLKYGKLEISYGLVNDLRNGTTKPIPSLMFSIEGNGEKCLWVSMIFGSMITNAWAHITVTYTNSGSLKVYFNGKENIVNKEAACLSPQQPSSPTSFVSSKLVFTCVDEIVVWNKLLSPDDIERLYNATVFGGNLTHLISSGFTARYKSEMQSLSLSTRWEWDVMNFRYRMMLKRYTKGNNFTNKIN